MSIKSGHRILPVTGEEGAELFREFEGYRYGTIRIMPGRWFITSPFIEFADKVYDFEIKPTDVIVMSFPKSGSTWAQEIIWTLLHNPNLDNRQIGYEAIYFRSPCLEADAYGKSLPKTLVNDGNFHKAFSKAHPDRDPNDGILFQLTELCQDPRVFKTHLPFELLPPSTLQTSKVVYIVREPKDVLVSYYKFARVYKLQGFLGTLDSFMDHLLRDRLILSPYWAHVKQAWEKRNHPNLLFVYYEDLKTSPFAEIDRIQTFLGLSLTTTQIMNIVNYTSFDAMKGRENLIEDEQSETFVNMTAREEEGGFFNKGKVGTWKERLTKDQEMKMNEWIRENAANLAGDFKYKNI